MTLVRPHSVSNRALDTLLCVAGVEIGPQAHGTLQAWTLECARVLSQEILDFVERFNTDSALELPAAELEVYRLLEAVHYPTQAADPEPTALEGFIGNSYAPLVSLI